MITIPIVKDWYDDKINIFSSNTFELNENVLSILVGCNGSGKSTLIHQIKDYFLI